MHYSLLNKYKYIYILIYFNILYSTLPHSIYHYYYLSYCINMFNVICIHIIFILFYYIYMVCSYNIILHVVCCFKMFKCCLNVLYLIMLGYFIFVYFMLWCKSLILHLTVVFFKLNYIYILYYIIFTTIIILNHVCMLLYHIASYYLIL